MKIILSLARVFPINKLFSLTTYSESESHFYFESSVIGSLHQQNDDDLKINHKKAKDYTSAHNIDIISVIARYSPLQRETEV